MVDTRIHATSHNQFRFLRLFIPSLIDARRRLAEEELPLDEVLEDELGRPEVVRHAAGLHEPGHQGQGGQPSLLNESDYSASARPFATATWTAASLRPFCHSFKNHSLFTDFHNHDLANFEMDHQMEAFQVP